MTVDRRFERQLPEILEDLYLGSSPTYRDEVLAAAVRPRQRPAWTFPGRWIPMDVATRVAPSTRLPLRQLGILALIAILVAVAVAVAVGSQRHAPPPFGPARNGLIVYAKDGDIYLGDPLTGQSRALVAGPESDNSPQTSPDGTRITFTRNVSDSLTDIYVVNIDGSRLHPITSQPFDSLNWGEWAPDGRHFAVVHQVEATPQQCPTTLCNLQELDMVDVDGGSPPATIATARGLSYVKFRPPDGRQILYRALVDDKWGLFAMDADGKNVRSVVPPTVPPEMDATFGSAQYSPDGNRVFFNEYTLDASFGQPGCCQLFVVNADGTDLHKFIPNSGDTWDGAAAVSPDGKRVAFWHNLPNRTTHRVTVIRADGTGQPIETGPDLTGTAHWIWAPDSSKILMFPDGVDNGKAYLLDPNGGPATTVSWTSTGDLDWQRLGQ